MMDRKTFIARLRQLLAADKNAFSIYSDLAQSVQDDELQAAFLGVARDEKRHEALDKEILTLLGG